MKEDLRGQRANPEVSHRIGPSHPGLQGKRGKQRLEPGLTGSARGSEACPAMNNIFKFIYYLINS